MTVAQNMEFIQEKGQNIIDKYLIPGVALGIAQGGQLVYGQGFGYSNIANRKPVTLDTVFGIASVTKSITCVAIMQLQEAGKLNVYDPVVNYLDTFKTPSPYTETMTIHHFMTHSSGIPPLSANYYARKRSLDLDPSVKDFPGLTLDGDHEREPIDTHNQLLEYIGQLTYEVLGEPGTAFSYSNDCYALLGAIIEKVSGKPYDQYIKDHILAPIGMTHSCGLIEELDGYEDVTSLYAMKKGEQGNEVYEAPVWWHSPAMLAAGYLKSTVNDMLKYAEIFRNQGKVGNQQLLTPESVKAMMHPHIEYEPGKYYGYGLMVTPNYYGGTLVEHGGSTKAVSSQLVIVPERNITGMVLANLAGVPSSTLLEGALNVYEGRAFDAAVISHMEYACTADDLLQFAGEYVSNEGMKLTVSVKDSNLEFSASGATFPVTCIGEDLFLASVREQTEVIRFIRNDSGEISRVAYHLRQFPKVN